MIYATAGIIFWHHFLANYERPRFVNELGTKYCGCHCILFSTISRKTIVLLSLCIPSAYVMLYYVQHWCFFFFLSFCLEKKNDLLASSPLTPSRGKKRRKSEGKFFLHPHPPPMKGSSVIYVFNREGSFVLFSYLFPIYFISLPFYLLMSLIYKERIERKRG